MKRLIGLIGLVSLSLAGCHPNSFEYRNATDQPILLTIERKSGSSSSIQLAPGTHVGQLPSINTVERVRYQYGETVCELRGDQLTLAKGAWNEAQALILKPCDGAIPID
ncbi:MAG: hypothetical protein V4707_01735 [Pseudomonadota bacterium]